MCVCIFYVCSLCLPSILGEEVGDCNTPDFYLAETCLKSNQATGYPEVFGDFPQCLVVNANLGTYI